MHLKEEGFSLASHSLKYQLLLSLLHAQLIISFLLRLSGVGGIDRLKEQGDEGLGSLPPPPQMHTATAGTSMAHPRRIWTSHFPKKHGTMQRPLAGSSQSLTQQHPFPNLLFFMCPQGFYPPGAPHSPPHMSLLYSVSFLLVVLSFLMISCFLDFTMAELLSVSLLKKAGG